MGRSYVKAYADWARKENEKNKKVNEELKQSNESACPKKMINPHITIESPGYFKRGKFHETSNLIEITIDEKLFAELAIIPGDVANEVEILCELVDIVRDHVEDETRPSSKAIAPAPPSAPNAKSSPAKKSHRCGRKASAQK